MNTRTEYTWKFEFAWRSRPAWMLFTILFTYKFHEPKNKHINISFIYFMPLISLHTPWKHHETSGFLICGGLQKEINGIKQVKETKCEKMCLIGLNLKNWSFAVTWPTQHRRCRLKTLYQICQSKKKNKLS